MTPVSADVTLIPVDDAVAWRRALEGVPHAPGHLVEHCRAMARTSGLPTHLWTFRTAGTRAVCPVSVVGAQGARHLVSPVGFAGLTVQGDARAAVEGWTAWASDEGYVCAYLTETPLLPPAPGWPVDAVHDGPAFYLMDIRGDAGALLAGMSRRRREVLRRAEPGDVEVAIGHPDGVPFLCARHAAFMAGRSAATPHAHGPDAVALLAGAPRALVAVARERGTTVAASLFLCAGDAADYVLHASLPGAERHSALLIWHAVLGLRGAGVATLNLGGGVRGEDGVAEFKRRFGAARTPTRVIKQVLDPARYVRLCRDAGADAGSRQGFFPAYARPPLPSPPRP